MAKANSHESVTFAPTDVIAGRYPHVIDYLLGAPWAILPEKLRAIADVVVHRAYRGELPQQAIEAAVAQRRPTDILYATAEGFIPAAAIEAAGGALPSGARNVTAVVPIMGTIVPRVSAMDESSGMFSLAGFRRDLAALVAEPAVTAIVLDIDSPGGSVSLVQETGAEIRAAAAKKTIGAVADTSAMSAAYWLFTQATRGFQYVSPSGNVGSVGVITAHEDVSRALDALGVTVSILTSTKAPFKAEGNPYAPLSAEARANIQSQLDSYHADFRSAVARGRGVSVAHVDEQFGGGRYYRGTEAVQRGMADKVGTLEDLLRAISTAGNGGSGNGRNAARAASQADERSEVPIEVNVDALGAALVAGLAQGRD